MKWTSVNTGLPRKEETTQPLVYLRECYCCARLLPCAGRPGLCERCQVFVARMKKIGDEDRRSVRARVPIAVPSNVLEGLSW